MSTSFANERRCCRRMHRSYYDDEELDALAGIAAEDYTPEQHEMVRAVFTTLQESDVPGWCRSMQLRNIALPEDIREEALLIVRERRKIR